MSVMKHVNLLGFKAKDVVTGFDGVITSVSFDLYGCIQILVTPRAKDEDDLKPGYWFDVSRLTVSSESVMEHPDFDDIRISDGKKGCADKPRVI